MSGTQFLELPDEAILLILELCSLKSVGRMARTCRQLHALCEEDHLWRALAVRQCNIPVEALPDLDVKQFVMEYCMLHWSETRKNKQLVLESPRVLMAPENVTSGFHGCQSDRPLPSTGCFYFELKCEVQPRPGFDLESSDWMSIGIANDAFNVAGQGWVESNTGIGWYSFNGRVFQLGQGMEFMSKIRNGDVCGIMVNRDENTVSFYFNRVKQGFVVTEPRMVGQQMYMTVNLMQPGRLTIVRAGPVSPAGPY